MGDEQGEEKVHKEDSLSPNERIAFMQKAFTDALLEVLEEFIELGESTLKTFVQIVFLIMKYGTVCLWRLAAFLEDIVKVDSVRRRFYRFFQFVQLSCVIFAKVIVKMLGLHGKLALGLDPRGMASCYRPHELEVR
jgi:hypothetical protein